ncbi:MAG TPA: amino acid permease [Beijerinckiaceae bacterium]|jgi:amino acid transporter
MSAIQDDKHAPSKTIGVLEGVAFVTGIVIGVGIFRMPPLVAANTPSELVFLLAWAAGGLAMLIGSLCYAELAAAYPDAGGEYQFLRRAYGARLAVLFAWARGTVIQTGAIAYVAFVFGDYAQEIWGLGANGASIWAAVSVVVFTGVNLLGTKPGERTQVIFAVLTLAALAAVIVAGLTASAPAAPTAPAASGGGALGLAMVFVLLTYGGWNEVAYLSGEMRDVRRQMVQVAVAGAAVVTTAYVLVNLAYLNAFGFEGLRESKAVGADLMRVVVGDRGATVLALIICCAAISTLNATIFTGARTYYALGRDLPMVRRLGVWDPRGGNPANAFLLQGVIALALVGFGATTRDGFSAMVDYTAPVFWFFLLLVGVALFLFRMREPDRERPFRVPLYPITPAIFVGVCSYLLYSSLAYTGYGALFGVGVVLLGAPLALFGSRAREE